MITGKAKLAGIMGWPVGHSRSPRLHNHWLALHGIDGAYVPLPVKPEDLAAAVRALPKLGFRGANLTVPHKEAVIPLLDSVDPGARRIGAVNTLIVGPDGALHGASTDGAGFMANLRQSLPDFDPARGPAVVLGAGGAARSVIAALLDAGAPAVRIANRSPARVEALIRDLGGAITPVPFTGEALADAALLVNTTSLGMTGQPPLEIDLEALPPIALVTDIVYAPIETDLLARARARGNPVVDGLGMLLHQAVEGFEAWFGVRPRVDKALRRHVLED